MANMANMNQMGGPVGPQMMVNNGAPAPHNQNFKDPVAQRTLLHTYIYDYFLRCGMYDCARSVYQADPQINVKPNSPGSRRDENGNLEDHPMDGDSKDGLEDKRPDDLPAPALPSTTGDSSFLNDWYVI